MSTDFKNGGTVYVASVGDWHFATPVFENAPDDLKQFLREREISKLQAAVDKARQELAKAEESLTTQRNSA